MLNGFMALRSKKSQLEKEAEGLGMELKQHSAYSIVNDFACNSLVHHLTIILDAEKDIQSRVNSVVDLFEDLYLILRFDLADEVLLALEEVDLPTEVILAVLMSTKMAADHLAMHARYYQKAKAVLTERLPDRVEKLLKPVKRLL